MPEYRSIDTKVKKPLINHEVSMHDVMKYFVTPFFICKKSVLCIATCSLVNFKGNSVTTCSN